MSQDNENKFDFDFSKSGQGSDAPLAGDDFNPFADDSISLEKNFDETKQSDDGEDFSAFLNSSFDQNMPASEGEDLTETGDTMAFPSFAKDEKVEPEPLESDVAPFDLQLPKPEDQEEKNKKGKKEKKEKKPKAEKKKKEKKERAPKDKNAGAIALDGWLSLILGALMLLGLIAFNVYRFLNPMDGTSGNSTLYYLMGVDLMGLCGIAAPFMFFASRTKPDETVAPEKKLDVFKVALGTAVMTTVFGVILLWTVLYSYDFETKPTKTIPALFIPQDNDGTEG